MKLSNILLTEAARFGNKEKSEVLKNIHQFRFGVEYEFNVNDGVSFIDKFSKIERPLDSPIIEHAIPHLTAIARAFHKFGLFGGVATLDDYASDMMEYSFGGATSEEIQYFNSTVIPESAELATWFYGSIIRPSIELSKIYEGTALKGLGVVYSSISPTEAEVIRGVAKLSNTRVSIDHNTAKLLRVALSAMARYFRKEATKVREGMSQNDHVDAMVNAMFAEIKEHTEKRESKIDIVKRDLPVNPSYLYDIKPDITVPKGVEVITKPLDFQTTMKVASDVFDYIKKVGWTDNQTGLHVNISMGNAFSDVNSVDFVKMMVLLDTDFFQGLSRGASKYMKYPVRSDWVTPVTSILTSGINGTQETFTERLAAVYAYNGPDAFINAFRSVILSDNTKMRSVNLQHIFANADVKQRRVEFRFLGGAGYENRLDELENDILQFCYVISAASDPSFLRREYLIGIMRIMDRATQQITFLGKQFSSFSSLVNYIRTSR